MNALTLYIDRLKDDDIEQIHEVVDSAHFELDESELTLVGEVTISGQAYLAKNHLILDLKLKAVIEMPCSICNQKVELPLSIDDFTWTQEICEIPSAVWDYSDEVRSALLLKVPQFLECQGGHCPERKSIKRYLTKAKEEETHTPFSNLDLL